MSRRVFALLYLGLGLVGLVAMTLWFTSAHRSWITTDNAEVWAPTYTVDAPAVGRIVQWTPAPPGSTVRAGQLLGRIATAAGTVSVRAPHAGRLVGDYGFQGDLVAPGQQIALVADLRQRYVLAYIDEGRAAALRLGEPVQLESTTDPSANLRGQVVRIYPAVASITWPLPPIQSGMFSKQAQWVPVRIRVAGRGTLYLGSSVTVGISIGGGSGE